MSRFARLKTSDALEKSGVWRKWTNGDDSSEIEFLLARAGPSNTEFRKLSEQVTRPYRKAGVDLESLSPDKQDSTTAELFAKTVVLDWRGPGVADIPFSVEACLELFSEVKDTLTFCATEARNVQNYREAQLAGEAGN